VKRLLSRRRDTPPRATSGQAPLVTVGITSYNEAARISRCLDSIAAQTLGAEHIEVLVVDDGSTDNTVAIARSHEQRAHWAAFTVLQHKGTGSPSKGRNAIMDQARGEFVFFVDADDYLGTEALRAMTRAASKRSVDIVVGRYVGINRSAPNVLEPRDGATKDYHSGWLNSLHVQKLFRTSFIRGLGYRFNESLIYASDHPFMISAFLHADRVAMVDDVDCYFLTMDAPDDAEGQVEPDPPATSPGPVRAIANRIHVSRAEIPAKRQLQFLHDCFGILALGRGQGGRTSGRAGKMRADYWNRLLKLHIPMLILRKDDDEAVVELAHQVQLIAELYGAETSRARLTSEAKLLLSKLSADGSTLRATAQQIRDDVRGARPAQENAAS